MSKRKAAQSEREASAEPMAMEPQNQQASEYQLVSESSRARMWEMHLRGVPKTRIATAVGFNRATVARVIASCYADVASDQKFKPARKLSEAVARIRFVQEHAWSDHDADDARERLVLEMSLVGGNLVELAKDAGIVSPDGADASAGSRKSRESNVSIKYQSQRSQYLRVILDAEKEIARLEGLYDGVLDTEAGATFSIRVLSESDVARLSGARRHIQTPQLAPQLNPPDGASDGEVVAP